MADIDHGREAQVDATGTDFLRHQPRMRACVRSSGGWIGEVLDAETGQRGQRAVAILETLDSAAFLVHADQLRSRGGLADRGREFGDLGARGEVALEQDHAGAGIVLQPVTLLGGEFGAGHADHKHCGRLHRTRRTTRTGIVADAGVCAVRIRRARPGAGRRRVRAPCPNTGAPIGTSTAGGAVPIAREPKGGRRAARSALSRVPRRPSCRTAARPARG